MNGKRVDLSMFSSMKTDDLIQKNTSVYDEYYGRRFRGLGKKFTIEEINNIIDGSDLAAQQELSWYFYYADGFYKRIILYYATILKYSGILIPNPAYGKELSTNHIQKRYYMAINYLDHLPLAEYMTRFATRALIEGTYYGIIRKLDKDSFALIDLPSGYCRSRMKDTLGNDVIEFNVSYFNKVTSDLIERREFLETYPKVIRDHYKKYIKNKTSSPWVIIPTDIGICFPFFDDIGRPIFLNVIPASIQYDDAVENERERELEEIRKIIVQKIPHLTDGNLLFEPDEALEMHAGAVNMMKGNRNLSILTTYADVDAIISRTASDNVSNSLEKMLQNVYSEAGVSSQLFAAVGTQALGTSIINDMSLMMVLARKFSRFFTHILNLLFANGNIDFKYEVLPISYYNQSDFITDALKLAQSGYSYLLPGIALGLSQQQMVNVKNLENDVLKLQDLFIPLSSSYTQSTGKVGAPEKDLEDKSPKTIQNEDAIDRQGGST